MRSLFRRNLPLPEAAGPPAASGTEALAVREAGLSRRLKRALARELSPGEVVELVVRPGPQHRRKARRQQALWLLLGLGLAAGGVAAPHMHPFWTAMAIAIFQGFSGVWQDRGLAPYVVTNQRCFRLALFGHLVHVRDVTQFPFDPNLEPEDLHELQQRYSALASQPGRRGRAVATGETHVARDLPPNLRRAIEEVISQRETLLWADRPTVRDYLLRAPLDFATASLGILAGLVCIVLLPGLGLFGPGDWVPLCAGLAGALWAATGIRLWQQVRGTVYAVTDRGGFVIAPGGRYRTYSLDEMRTFQRTQNATGKGALAPAVPAAGVGFYGVRDVKLVDDLIKGRTTRDRSTELTPADALPGRGDELSPG